VIKTIGNKVIRILVSSVPWRTRAVEDCVGRIMLDEPAGQRLAELDRSLELDRAAATGRQITEMLANINRPMTVPDVCAQAIWGYRPGL
jgi:hypothetical protein